jgi:hypothetical protein
MIVFRAESCSGICSGQRFDSRLRCSFCDSQKKRGSEKNKTINQAQHWVCWEAGHNTKHLNESGDGGDGN